MLDYEVLEQALQRSKANAGAAESQGMLCGILCARTQGREAWLGQLYDEVPAGDVLVQEGKAQLGVLYETCQAELNSGGLEFSLLLPADDVPLEQRGQALGAWCQGFLFGFGLSGLKLDELPEDSRELIQDMSEIAKLELPGEDSEEDETAFAEIVEYLRMGVLLINEELNPVKAAPVLH